MYVMKIKINTVYNYNNLYYSIYWHCKLYKKMHK